MKKHVGCGKPSYYPHSRREVHLGPLLCLSVLLSVHITQQLLLRLI